MPIPDPQNADKLKEDLLAYADKQRAIASQRFFKTGPGQYGEGDVFIGVSVPNTRRVCKKYRLLPLSQLQRLVSSKKHEYRLAALIIASGQFARGDANQQKLIYEWYMRNLQRGYINNWDLVDTSASYIVGGYLFDKPRDPLYALAVSESLWSRRVSILATLYFITKVQADDTLRLAEILLYDKYDLIHKAVGWMLREVGKRVDEHLLTDFLDKHAHEMPCTMLRYAIERPPKAIKSNYYNQSSIA